MTAPTEAEIRAVIEPECEARGTLNLEGRLSDAFTTSVLHELYDVGDLRESELQDLSATVYDALRPIHERAVAECRRALVAAGLRFAAEHPDAPRAAREPVPA